LLKIVDIQAGYGRIPVLRGVSLEIREGEIVSIIGGNGAGKSTLMKTICGVLPTASGSILYDGLPIERKRPSARVKRGLILVPEGRRILRRMSVHENLLMGAYARKDVHAIGADLESVFRRFPILEQRKKLSADVLSGGEQQMLAIGRALLAKPRLLMMDEPSLGLSPIMVNNIFTIIQDLHRSGITILLVEQNAQKALQVADRGYVMETGRIVLCDDAKNLLCSQVLQDAYLGKGKDVLKSSSRGVGSQPDRLPEPV
jgi:branched-chain amino acid transport system ATP-binding protein